MASSLADVASDNSVTSILHGSRNAVADLTLLAQEPAQVSLLLTPSDWRAPAIREFWDRKIAETKNIDVLFQSPEWFDYFAAAEHDKRLAVAVATTSARRVIGLAPLVFGRYPFRYEIKGRILKTTWLPALFIYGGESLFPHRNELYDALFALIDDAFPNETCICFFSMLKDTFCWRYLQESALIRERFFTYLPGGVRPYRAIALPESFDQYLKKFNSKKRYNLGRQLKLLEKAAGPLRLQTIQTRADVPEFFEMAKQLALQSWKYTSRGAAFDSTLEMLEDLADRGILRSYLLWAGDKPCAYVLGYQYLDVYYYNEVGYDQTLAACSPGTGLLYLLIKDLIENSSLRRLSFDFGDAPYKREFSNVHSEDATILLMRKTFSNRLRRAAHGTFTSALNYFKSWLMK